MAPDREVATLAAMTTEPPTLPEGGDLSIRSELGEVRNARGDSVRLGPVNMKVLELLVGRPGQVVSRAEIFDAVWKNQIVGDDTLTRSVSDIRAQLRQLTGRNGHIETIPKRGYRWLGAASAEPAGAEGPESAPGFFQGGARQRLLRWAAQGLAYLTALVLAASGGVWLLDRLAGQAAPIVAVLPLAAERENTELAAAIDDRLTEYLLGLEPLELLSRSAVESRPSNPFPYFYYEFDARWLIEPELRRLTDDVLLAVTLVDARTGIVLMQTSASFPAQADRGRAAVDETLAPIADHVRTELGR